MKYVIVASHTSSNQHQSRDHQANVLCNISPRKQTQSRGKRSPEGAYRWLVPLRMNIPFNSAGSVPVVSSCLNWPSFSIGSMLPCLKGLFSFRWVVLTLPVMMLQIPVAISRVIGCLLQPHTQSDRTHRVTAHTDYEAYHRMWYNIMNNIMNSTEVWGTARSQRMRHNI